jgi:TRAP-type C4-dicarboxylate transport system substrate-binding protein
MTASGCVPEAAPEEGVPEEEAAPTEGEEAAPEAPEKQVIEWVFPTNATPESPTGVAIQRFCDRIAQRSDGQLKLEPIFSQAWGPDPAKYEGLMRGDIQMAHVNVIPSFDPRFEMGLCAGYCKTYEGARRINYPGGVLYELIAKYMMEDDIRCLGVDEFGFYGVGTVGQPVESMDDLRGLKLGMPLTQIMNAQAQSWGAIPESIPSSELYTALETGVFDGYMHTIAGGYSYGFTEVGPHYFTPLNWFYLATRYAIREDAWQELPGHIQVVVKQVMREVSEEQIGLIEAERKRIIAFAPQEMDVSYIQPSKEFFQAFHATDEQLIPLFKEAFDLPQDEWELFVSGIEPVPEEMPDVLR